MPLQFLGQLSPTMQQQVALQRALLALQREDEEIRRRAEEKPALARGLGAGPTPMPSMPRKEEPAFKGGMEYAPITREPLARALGGTPGYISGEERMRMAREGIATEKEEFAAKAMEFWKMITPLDDEGRKIALDAARNNQPQLYDALIKQGLLDPATGEAVRLEKEKKFKETMTDPQSGEILVVYEDGTIERTGMFGPSEEAVVEAPTISEAVALQKLGMEVKKYEERHLRQAINVMGAMPRVGIDTMEVEGKEVSVEEEHVKAWRDGVEMLTKYFESISEEPSTEAPLNMEEVKAMYEGRPDLISDIQQNLGLTVTGVWDDELEEAFRMYGGAM